MRNRGCCRSMKKSIASMIIAVLSLLAIIFCVLWQHTVHDQTDFTTFAQAEANKAYTSFSAYQESGNDGDYWQGVVAAYPKTLYFQLFRPIGTQCVMGVQSVRAKARRKLKCMSLRLAFLHKDRA